MKNFRQLWTAFFFAAFFQAAYGQRVLELSIENQAVSGTNLFFDLYLTSHSASQSDIFLADSDFVLSFHGQNFTNPTLESVADGAAGFCTLTPTDTALSSVELTRSNYFAGTSPAPISNNRLIINLQAPKPDDQAEFDQNVARIDNLPSTHRLGRFKITGISNPNGSAGLNWVLPGQPGGIVTAVFSYEPVAPWTSTAVQLLAVNPIDFPLGVNSTVGEEQGLAAKIFPNPAKDSLFVEFQTVVNTPVLLEFWDKSGRLALRQEQAAGQGKGVFQLSLQDLAAGFYQVKMTAGKQVFLGKLLKVN